LEQVGDWEEMLELVEEKETKEKGTKWGNLVAMAINSYPDGIDEEKEEVRKGKRRMRDEEVARVVKKAKVAQEIERDRKRKRIGEEMDTRPLKGRPGPMGPAGPAL